MPKIVGFDPDPNIPDALVLGTGDLLVELDDGRVEARPIVEDIELASMGLDADYNRPKVLSRPTPTPMQETPQQQPQRPTYGLPPPDEQTFAWMQDRSSEHLADQAEKEAYRNMPSGSHEAPPEPVNPIDLPLPQPTAPAPQAATQQAPATGGLGQYMESQGAKQQGGMVPVQRTGALPPGVMASQLGQMRQQQLDEQGALETSRKRIAQSGMQSAQDELQLAQQNKADNYNLWKEQEEKQLRLEEERQQVADMHLERDLRSAAGGVGSVFHIIGAALLGAVGSDAGLKAIDRSISRHVTAQLQRRNSKLAAIRDRLGSTAQAVAAAKSAYYAESANVIKAMGKLQQWEQYGETTNVLLEEMESRHLEQEQKFVREGLGKTTEKLVSPGAANPQAVQKFGKEYRAQEQSMRAVKNVMDSVGAVWDPVKKEIVNREEVLREGFEGAGSGLTKLVPDSVAKWYYDVTDSKQGQQVLGAKKVIAYALARQMDPGGRLSDKDIELFMSAANMDTEEGYLTALENLLRSEGQDRASIMAQYGTPAVQQFFNERARRTGDGQDWRALQNISPGGARRATLEDRNIQSGAPAQEAGRGSPLGDDLPTRRPSQPGEEMPAQRTPVDIGEVQSALESQVGAEAARVLAAQISHETGKGNTFGYNLGGIKARDGEPYQLLMTREVINGEEKQVREPFASFDSLESGVDAYLVLLQRRYPEAIAAAERGDTRGFVRELKKKGYFTADENEYYNAFMRHYGGQ